MAFSDSGRGGVPDVEDLTTGREDAAFVSNGDVLLIAGSDGRVVKHNREKGRSY